MIRAIGRWIQVLCFLPAAIAVVWLESRDEERKERYERGEV